MKFLRVLSAVVSISLLVGCGGGGGGGGGGSSLLRYTTDWTNRGRAVTGLSQRAALYDLDGRLMDSIIVNQDVNGQMTVELDPPSNGNYRLLVELYSLRDLAGTKTGVIEALVTINGSTTFRSAVGVDPTIVRVTPPDASFQVQTSKQFYATAYSTSTVAAFVEPNGFTWSQLGGHVSITQEGLALGLSQGNGSIRATHTTSSTFGAATYTVDPFNTTTSKWTVMVFMNAANDLYTYSPLNMNQMESVAQNPDVRFVVQWKQSTSLFPGSSFNGTRRYLVKPDLTNTIASQIIQDMGASVDMGDPDTLAEFINWAKTYYPAQRYCLVVWNHGNGWRRTKQDLTWKSRAVSYDDQTGNAIQIWELPQSLGNTLFDIVSWDASLMQMIEVAYEIEDQAKYVVGSEESPPGEGLPYQLIFDDFRDNPDASTATLSKAFVDGMLAVPAYQSRKITQSVLDTTKLDALVSALNVLGQKLIDAGVSVNSVVQSSRNEAQSYSPTPVRVYRDLIHLCERIEANLPLNEVEVRTASQNVRAAAQQAIVWEGHNSNSPNSRGISIDFSTANVFSASANDYQLLKFAQASSWNEWLSVAP